MKKNKLLFVGFVLVVLAQLFIPTKMILNQEDILKTGKEFKFETTPLDPNDPFRGKYIQLRYKNNQFPITETKDWEREKEVYVQIKINEKGFAEIDTVLKEIPTKKVDFIKAKIRFVNSNITNYYIQIEYPFERFYMKETKAKNAEILHTEMQKDSTKTTYASVFVKDGNSVLNDILIDGISIKNLVEEENSN